MSAPSDDRGDGTPRDARFERMSVIVAALNDPYAIARRADDLAELVLETIELASVEAERLVVPHAIDRRPGRRGKCRVTISFGDPRLLAAFRSVEAVKPATGSSWTLVRRWAEADGAAALDEEMCLLIVRRLHSSFGGRLRARVLAIYER